MIKFLKNLWNSISRDFGNFVLGICVYNTIEVWFTALEGIWKSGSFRLLGISSPWMGIIGGLSFIIIGRFNEYGSPIKQWPEIFKTLLGTFIILFLEFWGGFLVNIVWKFNIYSYAHLPFNIMGQVSLLFAIFWFFLVPVATWFDDILRLWRFGEGKPYNIFDLFKAIFTGKVFSNK